MSLDFDVREVANKDTVTHNPADPTKWSNVTQGLVWLSLAIDLPGINAKNIDEFKYRARLYQVACQNPMGGYLGDGTALYITDADIDLHLGLRTNVSPTTRTVWVKKLGEMAHDHAKRVIAKQATSAHNAFAAQAEKLSA